MKTLEKKARKRVLKMWRESEVSKAVSTRDMMYAMHWGGDYHGQTVPDFLEEVVNKLLSLFKEEIIEKLNKISVDVVAPDRKPPYRVDYIRLDKAIKAIKDTH